MRERSFLLCLIVLGALTVLGTSSSCTVIYSGCESDSDCDTAAGEVCLKAGECGIPTEGCIEGDERPCEGAGACANPCAEFEGELQECPQFADVRMQTCAPNGRYLDCRTEDPNADYPEECTEALGQEGLVCAEPEICDRIDNDCDGATDEGIPGVNDPCTVGQGVCEARGNQLCNPSTLMPECDVDPNPPQDPACDCEDDNCDGTVDEFTVAVNPAPSLAPADDATWDIAELGGTRYAAVESGGQIEVRDLDADTTLATLEGHSPQLFISPATNRLVAFHLLGVDSEGTGVLHDEVHVSGIDVTGVTPATTTCASCSMDEAGPGNSTLFYRVIFEADADGDNRPEDDDALCTETLDKPCNYIIWTVRETNRQALTIRVDALDLSVTPGSSNVVLGGLAFVDQLVDLRFARAAARTYYALVLRQESPQVRVGLVISNQDLTSGLQLSAEQSIPGTFDTDTTLDVASLGSAGAVIVAGGAETLSAYRYRVENPADPVFSLRYGPVAVPASHTTAPSSVTNPAILPLCTSADPEEPQSAMLVYEVIDELGETTVEGVTLDLSDGSTDVPSSEAISGTRPRLRRSEDGFTTGALVPADDTGTVLTPAVEPLVCDG